MTTKFYLRDLTPTDPPTSGEKSSVLPVGTFKDGSPSERALDAAVGSSQATETVPLLSQTTHQDAFQARFTSFGVTAGTYGSGTWTLAINAEEATSSANAYTAVSLYFWNPTGSSVRGFVYDSDTHLGATEYGNGTSGAKHGKVLTFTGSNVTVQDGDVLVLEVWVGATQSSPTNPGITLYFNGTTDPTAGSAESSTASYLTSPQNLVKAFTTFDVKVKTASKAKATEFLKMKPLAAKVSFSAKAKADPWPWFYDSFRIERAVGAKVKTASKLKLSSV